MILRTLLSLSQIVTPSPRAKFAEQLNLVFSSRRRADQLITILPPGHLEKKRQANLSLYTAGRIGYISGIMIIILLLQRLVASLLIYICCVGTGQKQRVAHAHVGASQMNTGPVDVKPIQLRLGQVPRSFSASFPCLFARTRAYMR